MYCYKLNNSYTTYVNFYYLNDCIRASKSAHERKKEVGESKKMEERRNNHPPRIFNPLPEQTRIRHWKFGDGHVLSTDKNGIMKVGFGNREIRLLYPFVLEKGMVQVIKNEEESR